jgi:hypothetical protein
LNIRTQARELEELLLELIINVPSAAAAPTLVGHGKDFITVKWAAPASDGGASVSKYLLYVRAEYDAAY